MMSQSYPTLPTLPGIHGGGDGFAPITPGQKPPNREPPTRSLAENGYKYELQVVQQPKRARMCGFGDKDRRPITPPPCIRLIITEEHTGHEVDTNHILYGMFILNVDLWNKEGTSEVNLVRHNTMSGGHSSDGPPVSYTETMHVLRPGHLQQAPPPADWSRNQPAQNAQPPYNPYPGPPSVNPYGQAQQQQHAPQQYSGQHQQNYPPSSNGQYQPQYPPFNGYNGPPQQQIPYPGPPHQQHAPHYQGAGSHTPSGPPPPQPMYGHPPAIPVYSGASIHAMNYATAANNARGGNQWNPPQDMRIEPRPDMQGGRYVGPPPGQGAPYAAAPPQQQAPTGMFTRNLIGSLAASAARLTDTVDRIGIWFVLQDLSVRTEGEFRLRFSFVNVGLPQSPQVSRDYAALRDDVSYFVQSTTTHGSAKVLASCFSEPFTVYSAKKFPGVVESTHLSKCFATQGIKIPIRKDGGAGGKGKSNAGADEGDDDDDGGD